MSESFQQHIKVLEDFIINHPEIVIAPKSTSIPEYVRPSFNSLFEQMRENIIESEYILLLNEARLLSQKYMFMERKVARAHYNSIDAKHHQISTGHTNKGMFDKILRLFSTKHILDGIILDAPLDEFLHNPLRALSRELYDPFLDYFSGNNDIKILKTNIDQKIQKKFNELYYSGYMKWLLLNLVQILQPAQSYIVISPTISAKVSVRYNVSGEEIHEPVPQPVRTTFLDLRVRRGVHTLASVDVLLRLKNTGQYVGIKANFESGHYQAYTKSKRPFVNLSSSNPILMTDPIFMYIGTNAEDASLVSDNKSLWCPDLIIELSRTENGNVSNNQSQDLIKPLKGTVVIPSPLNNQTSIDKLNNTFSVLNLGFDASKLEPLLKKLLYS